MTVQSGATESLPVNHNTKSLRSVLSKGASGSFGIKILQSGLTFVSGVLLARAMGAVGYGAYSYALSWATFLAVPAVFGLDRLLIREIASGEAQGAWPQIHGLLKWANRLTLLLSCALASIAALVAYLAVRHQDAQMQMAFLMAMLLLPLFSLTRLRQSALQGLHKVVVGQTPEQIVRPALVIVLVGAVYLIGGNRLTAIQGVELYLLATLLSYMLGAYLLNKHLSQQIKNATPTYETKAWIGSALPLVMLSGVQIINGQVGVLQLGSMEGAKAVGLYAVASRGADFISFSLLAVNAALAPTAAVLYAQRDMERLQRIVTKSSRVITLLACPIAFILLAGGDWYLGFFGPEFSHARLCLSLLCVSQLFNALSGSVGLLLIMSGHERQASISAAVSSFALVALGFLLIPRWGVNGAAVAAGVSMILNNALNAWWVYRYLGIQPTALGGMTLRSSQENKYE